ncbi:MAG TPA: hypothetical protein VKP00_05630, partial [Gemmatimonadaceae bacterium]|nr:hypothetical protein [Gemmatimonadaceae bacterium]
LPAKRPVPAVPEEGSNRQNVAARVRTLVDHQDDGDPAGIARRLRVDELELRITIDSESPHPTINVLLAVIRDYAVDPTWLLTGDYDSATHRRALDADRSALVEVVKDVARRHDTPLNLIALPGAWHDHGPPSDAL